MNLYFITSNKNKFEEAKSVLPQLKQLNIDLPEIQHLNPEIIIKHKLEQAPQKESYIVEDTSLYIKELNDLPGPLIKWFLEALGNEGLFNLAKGSEAKAKTIIGYKNKDKIHFFEGSLKGKIVKPQGKNNFGWDPIFQYKNKTFAQMTKKEKNKLSMRKKAFQKLKKFLETA